MIARRVKLAPPTCYKACKAEYRPLDRSNSQLADVCESIALNKIEQSKCAKHVISYRTFDFALRDLKV